MISRNGNVGIGDTTPSYKLDVAGDINFTGNLYQNGSAFSGGGGGAWDESGGNVSRSSGNVSIGATNPLTKCVISHTPPTAIQNISDFHLQIGNNEHGHQTYRLIGFGFIYNRNK